MGMRFLQVCKLSLFCGSPKIEALGGGSILSVVQNHLQISTFGLVMYKQPLQICMKSTTKCNVAPGGIVKRSLEICNNKHPGNKPLSWLHLSHSLSLTHAPPLSGLGTLFTSCLYSNSPKYLRLLSPLSSRQFFSIFTLKHFIICTYLFVHTCNGEEVLWESVLTIMWVLEIKLT